MLICNSLGLPESKVTLLLVRLPVQTLKTGFESFIKPGFAIILAGNLFTQQSLV